MMTRSRFYRLALDANERQANVRNVDVLPIPTLDERATLYLRAIHGNRDFTEEERSNARNVLLNSMAAEIAAQVIPAEQNPVGEHGADRGSPLAQYAAQYWQSVQRKEAIKVAPIARRRTSILALTAAFGLVLMQIDNKGDSLNDNLWAEMNLMMALVVILLAILFLW